MTRGRNQQESRGRTEGQGQGRLDPDQARRTLERVPISVATVWRYHRRFVGWLARFYGVSYWYRSNYFCWHRILERLQVDRRAWDIPALSREVLMDACRL